MAPLETMRKTFVTLFFIASAALAGILNDPGFRCSRNGPDEIVCESLAMTESKAAPTWELYPLPNGERSDVARGWVSYLYPSPHTGYLIVMRSYRDGVHWIARCDLQPGQSKCEATAERP